MNVIWFEIYHLVSDISFKTVQIQCSDENTAVAKFRAFSESITACSDPNGGLVVNCEDAWKRIPVSFLNECIVILKMATLSDNNESEE